LAETGHALAGIARIEDGLDAYRATGAGLFVPYFHWLLATAHGAAKGQRLLAEVRAASAGSRRSCIG
jgi:hypothetical protein